MAGLELFDCDPPDARDSSSLSGGSPRSARPPGAPDASAPRTENREDAARSETSFSAAEEDFLRQERSNQSSSSQEEEEEEAGEEESELYLLSEDELSSDGSGKSVDFGFIIAVTCLVTGISLVAITYVVPRDARVDPDSVSAREMERLEREKARVGAHLDRCVIAGLCLLTLGGVLLSSLLMVSMWKGEMMRRKALAYSKHAAKLYGSMQLRGASPNLDSHLEEDLEVLS
ncbi:transmembrane protein 74 [Synchiropus splendidus]|uniref:transmembrane protein 74 n=1 Tax=Synchiropus splendidus TaxID=270530 RepID=UPI00237EB3A3|nr:transmembrane protein 74 [Synchiropus splendidus]